jgi:transposase
VTRPLFAQLRAERRAKARRLRAAGLSVRDIAERLGVSHPTVIADLRTPDPPTMTRGADPPTLTTTADPSEGHQP